MNCGWSRRKCLLAFNAPWQRDTTARQDGVISVLIINTSRPWGDEAGQHPKQHEHQSGAADENGWEGKKITPPGDRSAMIAIVPGGHL